MLGRRGEEWRARKGKNCQGADNERPFMLHEADGALPCRGWDVQEKLDQISLLERSSSRKGEGDRSLLI